MPLLKGVGLFPSPHVPPKPHDLTLQHVERDAYRDPLLWWRFRFQLRRTSSGDWCVGRTAETALTRVHMPH